MYGKTFNQIVIIWKRGVSGAASANATLQFMFTLVGEIGEYIANNYFWTEDACSDHGIDMVEYGIE